MRKAHTKKGPLAAGHGYTLIEVLLAMGLFMVVLPAALRMVWLAVGEEGLHAVREESLAPLPVVMGAWRGETAEAALVLPTTDGWEVTLFPNANWLPEPVRGADPTAFVYRRLREHAICGMPYWRVEVLTPGRGESIWGPVLHVLITESVSVEGAGR